MDSNQEIKGLRNQYLAALASSDSSLARYTVEQAQVQGIGILRIYLDILVSSQIDIGEMWHEGKINIAQEHLATTITLDIMNKLSIESTPRKPHGYRAIVTPVEGDNHIIGARMMGDFLKMDGWDVDFMGQPTPPQDLVAYFKNRPSDIVALSVTLTKFLPNVRETIDALRQIQPAPKILIGGLAVSNPNPSNGALGADSVSLDAIEGLSEARRLVGLSEEKLTLDDHLVSIGQKIRSFRTNSRTTQQQLANASGLDRTYISTVEQGKQNLTIGVLVKIADALDIQVSDLTSSQSDK
ncbi:MAG: cobalamin-dependent protein [Chloroflexota bacterium]|nr:cobalamin-dependent protein [Chloroflexota bacterium]